MHLNYQTPHKLLDQNWLLVVLRGLLIGKDACNAALLVYPTALVLVSLLLLASLVMLLMLFLLTLLCPLLFLQLALLGPQLLSWSLLFLASLLLLLMFLESQLWRESLLLPPSFLLLCPVCYMNFQRPGSWCCWCPCYCWHPCCLCCP